MTPQIKAYPDSIRERIFKAHAALDPSLNGPLIVTRTTSGMLTSSPQKKKGNMGREELVCLDNLQKCLTSLAHLLKTRHPLTKIPLIPIAKPTKQPHYPVFKIP